MNGSYVSMTPVWTRIHTSLIAIGIISMVGTALAQSPASDGYAADSSFSDMQICSFLVEPERFASPSAGVQVQLAAALSGSAPYASSLLAPSAQSMPAPRNNFIDDHIFGRIEAAGIEPSPLSSDTEFLRRISLDLTGRIPSTEQILDFISDASLGKRDALVDDLLQSPAFTDKWTMFLGDLFRLNGRASNVNRFTQGRDAFYLYLKDSVAQNKPYDVLVREMITASGDNHSVGAANFPVGGIIPMGPVQDTYDGQAAQVASMFLGIQVVDCLLCHDGAGHLDEVNLWGYRQTRLDMWGLSAFFAETVIQREVLSQRPRLIRFNVVDNGASRRPLGYHLNTTEGNRSARTPVGGLEEVSSKYPFALSGSATGGVGEDQNRRQVLATYITDDIQFARAAVNYIWEELMVEAFVTPSNAFDLDRLDPSNPPPEPWTLQPTNPELLEALAVWFQQNNFDLRQLIGLIGKSRAYQLSSAYPGQWLPEYVPYYARKFARRLDAEEFHDAVTTATGVGAFYPMLARTGSVLPPVEYAMQLPDTREPLSNRRVALLLDSLGRGDRDLTQRSSDSSALQALNLMNHDFITLRINADIPFGTIAQVLSETQDPLEITQRVYLATLSRLPTDQELALLLPGMTQLDRKAGAQYLQWILMNKLDFIFNY